MKSTSKSRDPRNNEINKPKQDPQWNNPDQLQLATPKTHNKKQNQPRFDAPPRRTERFNGPTTWGYAQAPHLL